MSFSTFITTELTFLTIYTIAVLFVPRHAALVRFVSAVALAAVTYVLREAFFSICGNVGFRMLVTSFILLQHLSASEIVWVSQLDSFSISGKNELPESIITQAAQAIGLFCNARRVGTRWQVKIIPATPTSRRLAKALLAYLFLDLKASGPPPDLELMAPGKETLVHLGSLSARDIAVRVLGTAAFWIGMGIAIGFEANIWSSFYVLTGLSTPKDAPPASGSVAKASTLRGFWGSFWHQWLRVGFTGHANFIVDSVLRIRRGTVLSRYARISFTFAISAVFHHIADVTAGIPNSNAGSAKFFLLQPLGIILEDGTQALLASRVHSARVRRIIGYVWVAVWLVRSSPTWLYASARHGPKQDVMLAVRLKDFVEL